MSLSQLYQSNPASLNPAGRPAQARLRTRLLLMPAWLLPAGLVLAFAAVFAVVYQDRLLPALQVRTVAAVLLADIEGTEPVRGSTGSKADTGDHGHAGSQSGGKPVAAPAPPPSTMLFQSGGWVEPDPLPIFAIALTDGVIRQVHVLEGQEVRKGQILAELIDDDARIALQSAQRAHERALAELALQEVQIAVADADASAMADQVKVAEAKLGEEKDNQARISRIPVGSVSDQERSRARFLVEGQAAEVAARKSQHTAALAKVGAARAQQAVLEAAVAAAEVEVQRHQLTLSRTHIEAPVDGVILELHAAPGQKKLLGMDDHQSATIATLYEKGRLQARVDVPLADARNLSVGQEAVITSDFLPNAEFRGVVSRIVGSANLQRNTLQAKVRILDPDPRLRPEMLCRVKFMGGGAGAVLSQTAAASASFPVPPPSVMPPDATRAVMVPEEAVIHTTGEAAHTWVISARGDTATRRAVVPGLLKRDGFVAIGSGILPGELVILPPHGHLKEGRRVQSTSATR